MTRPRIKDIADRAGVSPATVSNALNGRSGVSEAVTQRIQRLAREMGYLQPHERGYVDKQRFVRLVVYRAQGIVGMEVHFYSELIEHLQTECRQEGIELLITHITPKTDPNWRMRIAEVCREECEGVLLLGTEMAPEECSLFKACRSPLVVMDNLVRDQPFHAVTMNNLQAGALAVRTLYDAGFRRIGHITSQVECSNVIDRQYGYEAEMAIHGLTVRPEDVWKLTPSIDGAYEDVKALLAAGTTPPEAIFSANDLMAIGAIRALTEAGYRVPEDVSVIGMDDTAVCMACTPTLTSLRVSRHDMSVAAVHMLLHVVPKIRYSPVKTEINVFVTVRESVKGLSK